MPEAALLPPTPSRADTWFGRGLPRPTSRLLAGSWVLFALSLVAVLVGLLDGNWSSGLVISLLAFGGMTAFSCLIAIPLLAMSAFSVVKQVQQLAEAGPLASWSYSPEDLERLAALQAAGKRKALRAQLIVVILGLVAGLAFWPVWHGLAVSLALSLATAAALWLCCRIVQVINRGAVFPRIGGRPQILLTAEAVYQPGPPAWFLQLRGGRWDVEQVGDLVFLRVLVVAVEAHQTIRIAVPRGAEGEARALVARLQVPRH